MTPKEKAAPKGDPISINSKLEIGVKRRKSQSAFAHNLTRHLFGRHYANDSDIIVSRLKRGIVIVPAVTGIRSGIRFWRAEAAR